MIFETMYNTTELKILSELQSQTKTISLSSERKGYRALLDSTIWQMLTSEQ